MEELHCEVLWGGSGDGEGVGVLVGVDEVGR